MPSGERLVPPPSSSCPPLPRDPTSSSFQGGVAWPSFPNLTPRVLAFSLRPFRHPPPHTHTLIRTAHTQALALTHMRTHAHLRVLEQMSCLLATSNVPVVLLVPRTLQIGSEGIDPVHYEHTRNEPKKSSLSTCRTFRRNRTSAPNTRPCWTKRNYAWGCSGSNNPLAKCFYDQAGSWGFALSTVSNRGYSAMSNRVLRLALALLSVLLALRYGSFLAATYSTMAERMPPSRLPTAHWQESRVGGMVYSTAK